MTADTPDGADGEGFLSRWSRRKQQVAREGDDERAGLAPGLTEPEPAAVGNTGCPSSGAAAETQAPASAPGSAEPVIDLSKLPSLDELTADTDYTQFLARGVPEELRTAALRRAWTLDPKIRDFVEVAENQWNWNVPGGVPGSGELAAGTDFGALLAQATGQIPAPEPPPQIAIADAPPSPPAVRAIDAAPQQTPDGAATDHTSGAAEPQPQVHASGQVLATSSDSQPEPLAQDAPPEHNARGVRRRHGGALPG